MFKCRTCQKEFSSERSLEGHLKVHGGAEEYYKTHFPRFDPYDKSFIEFKDKRQYLSSFFNSHSNRISYYTENGGEEAKETLLKEFQNNKDHKGYSFLPCHYYFKLSQLAGVDIIKKLYGSCKEFADKAGVLHFYNKKLPQDFWEDSISEFSMEVHIDTREQKPFEFTRSINNKLDFGDYTVGGERYSKTFVDRKSPSDFLGTFSSKTNFDRFKKEIKRANDFNSFLFVVVESTVDGLEQFALKSKFHNYSNFALHNVRDILINDYESCQFVFCQNRQEANDITRKILYHGREMWNCDLGYFLNIR